MVRRLVRWIFVRRRGPSVPRPVAERAAMLRALVCSNSAEPNVTAWEALAAFGSLPLESEMQGVELGSITAEDLALAAACLELEREIRARDWQSLERLLGGFDEEGRHHWPDERSELISIASGAHRIGWLNEPPANPFEKDGD